MRSQAWPLLLILVQPWIAVAAEPRALDKAFPFEAIDIEQCKLFKDGKEFPVLPGTIRYVLGLGPYEKETEWRGGLGTKEGINFQYRICFKQPVTIGSVLGGIGQFEYLKAEAPYPGDPTKREYWLAVEAPPRQSGAVLRTLPPNTTTRAVLCTHKAVEQWSMIRHWVFFRQRLHNLVPMASANASGDYYPCSNLVTGSGQWTNAGKDKEGFVRGMEISPDHPAWVVLSWPKKEAIIGVALFATEFGAYDLWEFVGPDDLNPAVGTEREWRKIPSKSQVAPCVLVRFNKQVTTRGLRLRITSGGRDPKVAGLGGFHVYTDLVDEPVPASEMKAAEPPPIRIPYTLAKDGRFTLVINDEKGHRVRNLVALVDRKAGRNEEAWDGKDLHGQYVQPGRYTWKAITHQPLELRYQFTVYPNAASPGWQIGNNGPGGWLADHSNPVAVCTAGERVYMGAPCAESGVSFIECDLTGRKLWGYHSFAAWTGPQLLASDGTTVFVGVAKENQDIVWGVDIKTKEVREVCNFPSTESRKAGLRGIAAGNGKLYLSVHGSSPYLARAIGPASVDSDNCIPRYPVARKPRKPYEIVPDPRTDFLRLFRLQGEPPGYGTDHGLTYLETTPGPGRKQHIVLALNKPQAIGTIIYPVPALKDTKVILSVLKPEGKYPPVPDDEEQWIPFEDSGKTAWDVVPAPENTVTRALRITFKKGGDGGGEELEEIEEAAGGGDDDLGVGTYTKAAKGKTWKGQLEGMTLLRRRFKSLYSSAKIRVNSGEVNRDGEWDAKRTDRPLTEADPGIFVMEWEQPQKFVGLAIKEIDGRRTLIDAYTGPEGQAIQIDGQDGWEHVATYIQNRRDHHSGFESCNALARYMDGYVDFGREITTRALRLRVVEQWVDHESTGDHGVRPDRGGMTLDTSRCRIYGVAPLSYIGGEAPVDPRENERITIFDLEQNRIAEELAIEKPGQIALGPAGSLFALSAGKLVRVDREGGAHTPLVRDLMQPTALTVDAKGRFYVFDNEPSRRQVRVYEADGKFVKAIGTSGGHKVGAWDTNALDNCSQLAVDMQGSLWCVEDTYWPKRITKWSSEGKFVKEFLGPTQYGGGGVLDPEEPSRLFYGPLEFEIDWEKGTSRLKNLTWKGPTPAGEVPIRLNGRMYVVTRGEFAAQECGIVYLYEKDHLRLAAAVGWAGGFGPLREPEVWKGLGCKPLVEYQFVWSDLNGDGRVQAEEVKLKPRTVGTLSLFNKDLGIQGGSHCYQVKEFLPNGVPIYEEREFPAITKLHAYQTLYYRLNDGSFFVLGEHEAAVKPDGEVLWLYEAGPRGVQQIVPPYYPGQVICEFGWVGHEVAPAGDLGEFVVINANLGSWNIWTADGLLAGVVLEDLRSPGCVWWTMEEHYRGLRLDRLTAGQEHFAGYFCKTKDGRFYIVAGHNHASIVEVKGMESFKRLSGEFELTTEALQQCRQWELREAQRIAYAQAAVADCYRLRRPPTIDGKADDWGPTGTASFQIGENAGASLKIAYDDSKLYLFYETRGLGPLKNTGEQWDRLYKTGGSVDIQLGTNPDADRNREAPVEGDFRLLLTFVNDKPAAVLYKPVVPGTPPDKAVKVVSPVASCTFDEILVLNDVEMKLGSNTATGYSLEVAVPLKDLGLNPEPGTRLKFDWGVLRTDETGRQCTGRLYWSNKATTVIADAPSEARLHPNLWGDIRFHDFDVKGPDIDKLTDISPDGTAKPADGEVETEDE